MSIHNKSPLLAGAATMFLLLGGNALGEGDIVWPVYSQASHTTDVAFTCTQLHAEIDHVSSDIKLLEKARNQVEDSLRSAFDLNRYTAAKQQGRASVVGNGGGEETFSKARDEIVASGRVAVARRNFLTNLLAICKDTRPPQAAPAQRSP